MLHLDTIEPVHVATIETDGTPCRVSLRTVHDGIEYVGHLWFADARAGAEEYRDHAVLPGRTPADVLALAQRLTPDELRRRHSRALAEKRRYLGLRRVTEDVLQKIRYLNQVAASMRTGALDLEGAAHEIALTEQQLHELVSQLRDCAGVEDA